MSVFNSRSTLLKFMIALVTIVELVLLFKQSGVLPGEDARVKVLRAVNKAQRENLIKPGDILDRIGDPIVTSEWITDNRTQFKTTYHEPLAYGQLVGYTSQKSVYPNAETPEIAVGEREDYRLMKYLDSEYWEKYGLYRTETRNGDTGYSAQLTISNSLQTEVYKTLSKIVNPHSNRGSALVMDAKTGEILSMVAFPAYDFNDKGKAYQAMEEAEKNGLAPSYPITYKGSVAPGSIFKLVTAVALLDNGMEDFTVKDAAYKLDGVMVKNAYASNGQEINYHDALVRSSNVFFSKAAMELGEDKIRETAAKFMLRESEDGGDAYLPSDFGSIAYLWELDGTRENLAWTGFGQGKTELTTVFAAMIAQTIANDGKMMQPYLVKSMISEKGKTAYEGKPSLLSAVTSKKTADKITDAMREAAKRSCSYFPDSVGD